MLKSLRYSLKLRAIGDADSDSRNCKRE